MKVLVTGGTGLVGRRVIDRLTKRGDEIILLTRDVRWVSSVFRHLETIYAWDIKVGQRPLAAFKGVEGVIHLAGEGVADKRWSDSRKKEIYNSRIVGTRHMASALSSTTPELKAFVSASAVGFYGDRGDEILTETSQKGKGFLSDVCRDWEMEATKLPASVRTCSLRIGMVLASDGGAMGKLLPLFKLGLGGPVGSGKQWMSWIHVDDLAELFVRALTDPKLSAVVNAVSPNPVTNTEFSKTLGKVLHRPAVMKAPAIALKLAIGEVSELVLSSQRVLPKRAESAGFSFRYPELFPALQAVVQA